MTLKNAFSYFVAIYPKYIFIAHLFVWYRKVFSIDRPEFLLEPGKMARKFVWKKVKRQLNLFDEKLLLFYNFYSLIFPLSSRRDGGGI